jgi:microcompartment protein CcmL/EutN
MKVDSFDRRLLSASRINPGTTTILMMHGDSKAVKSAGEDFAF